MKRLLLLCLILLIACNNGTAVTVEKENQAVSSRDNSKISLDESKEQTEEISEITKNEKSAEENSETDKNKQQREEASQKSQQSTLAEALKEDIKEEFDYVTLYDSYSPNIKEIQFDMVNYTDELKGFSNYHHLQIKKDGQWKRVETVPLEEGQQIVNPAISRPFFEKKGTLRTGMRIDVRAGSDIPFYNLPLEEGVYRIIDENDNVSNPFTVTDEPDKSQKRLIDRLSGIVHFNNINFLPCDFSVPFAYKGVISDYEKSGVKIFAFLMPSADESSFVYSGISEDGCSFEKIGKNENGFFTFGEPTTYNWEDTPHFFRTSDMIFLYCGDDSNILNMLFITTSDYNIETGEMKNKYPDIISSINYENENFFQNLNPLYYGGAYYDENNVINVLSVDKEKLLENEFVKKLVEDKRALLKEGDYISLSVLNAAQERLWEKENYIKLSLTSGNVDERNNSVVVYTLDISEENKNAIMKTAGIEKVVIYKGGLNPLT